MHRRFKGLLIVAAAAVLLHAGPVAACVCADVPAPAMPCCPDGPQGSAHDDHGLPTTERHSACEATAAELLVGSSQELPAPIWIAAEAPPLWTHGPPVAPTAARPAAYESPPIYLVTLRLRN